jgi:hypothetical protein
MVFIKKVLLGALSLGAVCCSCQKDLVEYESGDMKVVVTAGDEWKHDYDLFLGLKKKNPPQIAIWLEDLDGNYLSTMYVSHKAGTNSWQSNGGDPRKEALPYWNHKRMPASGQSDGTTGATTRQSIPDAVTGATPKGSFDIRMLPNTDLDKFVVKAEFNHSEDWNEYYPESAKEGDANYSADSGQPALVYEAVIDPASGQKEYRAQLIGHSSPDGTDGKLYTDTSVLTTAKNIVKEVTIKIID